MRENRVFQRAYLIGAALVWVGILLAAVLVLQGTPYLGQMLLILGAGVFWFVILIPGIWFWRRPTAGQQTTTPEQRRA